MTRVPDLAGPRRTRFTARKVALVAHRYVGLLLAAFLTLAGLTGSLIAFYPQLDAALNPRLLRVEPRPARYLLDPIVLHEKLRAQLPKNEQEGLYNVVLHRKAGETVSYWVSGREVFVDPYSGDVLGSRKIGDLFEGRKSLLTFVYRLHFSLALDEVGIWLMGGVALLWTLDCFVGAYLTFPAPAQRAAGPGKSWLGRWLPAWRVKTSKLFALIFTWHRASGLWVWLMLVIFAWSAVALNLRDQVYSPVMRVFFGERKGALEQLPQLPQLLRNPRLALGDARDTARRLMDHEAKSRGFRILSERWLSYDAAHGVYSYTVESSLDLSERLAGTTLLLDGNSGEPRGFDAPTGQHPSTTVSAWLIALHFGSLRSVGLAYRCFVSVMGLLVALLSVSGLIIWFKKRRQRRAGAKGSQPALNENDNRFHLTPFRLASATAQIVLNRKPSKRRAES